MPIVPTPVMLGLKWSGQLLLTVRCLDPVWPGMRQLQLVMVCISSFILRVQTIRNVQNWPMAQVNLSLKSSLKSATEKINFNFKVAQRTHVFRI